MNGASNCHLRAWRHLRSGHAEYLCIRFTAYSRLARLARGWWWLPARLLGIGLQWLAWPIAHLGELLRTGRWYHATWIRMTDHGHWEYVPDADKRVRWVPPIVFRGVERPVDLDAP